MLDAMTDRQKCAAAEHDPDCRPPSKTQLDQFKPVALARRIRMALGLSPKAFSAAYGIPLTTLLGWERHDIEPNPVELSYLRLIERDPERARAVPA